ncbi:MAG TPA: hypothetical protein VGG03_19840 [Thermoanaerobaculia bacterium]|jgi:hypothetical protein
MAEVRQLHKHYGDADIETTWQHYLAEVRAARPGSPVYAPHPFPKSDAEIVGDFKYAYFDRLFEGMLWEKLPAKEQPVFRALKENRLRIEIVRIENWDLSRCGRTPVPYYNLLRFFDPVSGKEVARSAQDFTGLMGIYHNLSERVPALPALPDVDALVRSRFGRTLAAEQAQYVTVGGLPYCSVTMPCIAFKSAGKLYLIDRGTLLYEIAPTAPRMSVTAFRDQQAAAGLPRLGAVEFDAPMITLGFEWARARLVGGEKPE